MSFHPQPNLWTCGPFALKHALIALGRPTRGEDLAQIAGSHWWSGTDEVKLARAARSQNCSLPLVRHLRADRAKQELNSQLRAGNPVLLCVDDWEHWVAVLSVEGSQYVVLDSNEQPVLEVASWQQLVKRWCYYDVEYDEEDPPKLYEMYPVIPDARGAHRSRFSVQRVRFLRRPENRQLAEYWNDYLEDLLVVCRPHRGKRLSFVEFMRRSSSTIVARIDYWHGSVTRKELEKQLQCFRFVAQTYGLTVSEDTFKAALADFTTLLTMWTVATHGVGEIYGSGPR